jgi:glycosyltransferase involved in cell wall biosynthesis
VNALLARAHVYVSTSLYEGFPNTFIQAWMRDVVVVSLTVDPDGVLEHGGVGVLARDETGLVTAIRRLAGDEKARERYTVKAGLHARELHSLANVKRIAALLEGADSPAAP